MTNEKYIGMRGYVKLDKGLYAYGEIVETGFSGASGFYLLVSFYVPKGNHCKIAINSINELIRGRTPKGTILKYHDA